MANRVFRHNKSGEVYELVGLAIECTNARVGYNNLDYAIGKPEEGAVAVYRLYSTGTSPLFVRDYGEFLEKFTEI